MGMTRDSHVTTTRTSDRRAPEERSVNKQRQRLRLRYITSFNLTSSLFGLDFSFPFLRSFLPNSFFLIDPSILYPRPPLHSVWLWEKTIRSNNDLLNQTLRYASLPVKQLAKAGKPVRQILSFTSATFTNTSEIGNHQPF